MMATEKTTKPEVLKLDAWGGTVCNGEECWIIDTENYAVIRVESALLVEIDYEAQLLHESRTHKYYRVAKTRPVAADRLERQARSEIDTATKRIDKARRYLATLS